METKVKIYNAVILTTLLYRAESWVTYCWHIQLLKSFHKCCLCTILNINRTDYVTNNEALETAKTTSTETMLQKMLLWTGHVSRMEDYPLPKVIMFGKVTTGTGLNVRGISQRDTETSWKYPSPPVVLITFSGQLKLLIGKLGAKQSIEVPQHSRLIKILKHIRRDSNAKIGIMQHLHFLRPTHAPPVSGYAYHT